MRIGPLVIAGVEPAIGGRHYSASSFRCKGLASWDNIVSPLLPTDAIRARMWNCEP
jgi:hypothetical protein